MVFKIKCRERKTKWKLNWDFFSLKYKRNQSIVTTKRKITFNLKFCTQNNYVLRKIIQWRHFMVNKIWGFYCQMIHMKGKSRKWKKILEGSLDMKEFAKNFANVDTSKLTPSTQMLLNVWEEKQSLDNSSLWGSRKTMLISVLKYSM